MRAIIVLAGLAATASGCLAAPLPKGASAWEPCFPVSVGAKWVYTFNQREVAFVAKSVSAENGTTTISIRRADGGGGLVGGTFIETADGVDESVTFPNGTFLRPPVRILKSNADGKSWESETTMFEARMRVRITAHEKAKIKVESGEYDAVRVDKHMFYIDTPDREPIKVSHWIAPRVGIVKWEAGDLKLELKSFDPGKVGGGRVAADK